MRTPVYIDILPESSSFSSSSHAPFSSPYNLPPQGVASHTSSDTPRPIRDIDSTVTFVSPSAVVGKSSYIVLLDGAPIHSEDTKLECVGPYFTGSSGEGPLLYSTPLVPKYWETLCKSPGPYFLSLMRNGRLIYLSPKILPYTPSFRMYTVFWTQELPQDPQVAHAQFLSSLLHTTSDIPSLYRCPHLPCHHMSHIKPIHNSSQTLLMLLPIYLIPCIHSLLKITLCPRVSRNKGSFSRTDTARKTGWTNHSYWMVALITSA